jgi:uncharacterized repeat protein (TIGR01451 family)
MQILAKWLVFFAATLTPSLAMAADSVGLTSTVFVERELTDSEGKPRIELRAPQLVTPGDRLVFILSYHNQGATPAKQFTVTNPLPSAVAFASTPDEAALVSVDGGRNWGTLSKLHVREDDGRWRSARPDDVTHIRWTLAQPLRVGGTGKLSFRGTVR